MHDIKAIRDNPDAFEAAWSAKGRSGDAAQAVKLDVQLRAAQTALQEAQAKRNESSKLIGQAKAKKDEAEASRLMAEVETLKGVMTAASEEEHLVGAKLKELLASLPNIPAPEVPAGEDEHGNVEQRTWGDASKLPAGRLNAPKDHVDLGAALGGMDFEAAARMSGARFAVLKERARPAGTRRRPVHAGPADGRAWLSGGEPAVSGQGRGDVRHRAVAEVLGRSSFKCL
jgi:seryl-tRNA synthetase